MLPLLDEEFDGFMPFMRSRECRGNILGLLGMKRLGDYQVVESRMTLKGIRDI